MCYFPVATKHARLTKLKCLTAATVVKARSLNARNASSNWSTLVAVALSLVAFTGGTDVKAPAAIMEARNSPNFAGIGGVLTKV